ncbi:hypothetical protein [Flavobacterium sp. LHD-85]|uniref:hypothetical protein n=1 Tax=Flavobacterium sp. LHD-85 TaxID=3071410 RepID=UPI0027E0E173|nr:hypothetical protein [Flavobacterium sp. LHD-85]MDQ6531274.1 hypothetical protein [Flavobacterium sp. LHD-85]
MKNYIYLLLFIPSFFCFAQEPPAIFKLKYSLLETDSINVSNQYKIHSPSLKYYKNSKNTYLTDEYWNNYKNYMRTDEEFIYVFMGNPYPRKNDIIILNIFKAEQSMTLFFKIDFDLDYGEKLYLKELKFVDGYYFIDLTDLKTKDHIYSDTFRKKEVDLSNIKMHKISSKKLNQKIQFL